MTTRIAYMRDGVELTNDFVVGSGEDAIVVPFGNLAVWNDDDLAEYGVTRTTVQVPDPVPASITRRQCAKQMLTMALITGPEALAMTKTGDAPAMVMALINQLPVELQIPAQIDFAADTYLRGNPLLISLMTAAGHTDADIDAFFVEAAKL